MLQTILFNVIFIVEKEVGYMANYKEGNTIVRTCVSAITNEQIKNFKKASASVDPKTHKISNCPADVLIAIGTEQMKGNNFQIADERIREL